MWRFENIPKILNLYWDDSTPFTFLKQMTIRSFKKLNPDWKIYVHVPEKIRKLPDFIGEPIPKIDIKEEVTDSSGEMEIILERKKAIKKKDSSFAIMRRKIPTNIAPEIIRFKIMSEVGGVWSDFDVLYLKPMEMFDPKHTLKSNSKVILCQYHNIFGDVVTPINFFMGEGRENEIDFPDSSFFSAAYERGSISGDGRVTLLETMESYLEDYWQQIIMPKETVYPYIGSQAVSLYFGLYDRKDFYREIRKSIGICWYGNNRNSRRFEKKINENNIGSYSNLPIVKMIEGLL